MSEVVRFFWERWKRAVQMDMANKLQGKPTRYWIEADEWVNAYKQTLSKSKVAQFDKEWNKLEKELEDYHNAPPKKQVNLNPMKI